MDSKSRVVSKSTAKSNKNGGSGTAFKFTLAVAKLFIILTIAFISAVAGIAGGAFVAWIKRAEPITPEQLLLKGFTTYVYDSDGNVIIPLLGDKNREMVDFKDIPQDLKDAVVAIEDKRFKEHNGIDLRRISGAVLNFLKPGASTHGGSTITQQVVKNLTGKDQRSVERKVQEWWTAMDLERKISKDQILELYMNLIFMGEKCYGVQSAAKKYFNTPVSELSLAQCASLAGITNAPSLYNPFTSKGKENNIERQQTILKEMLSQGFITQQEYDEATNEELEFADSNRTESVSSNQSYFIDQVIIDVKKDLMAKGYSEELAIKTIYNNGLKIYTTMDTKVQKAMDEVFMSEKHFKKINNKTSQLPQAGMVIMDADGYVRALYGGAGPKVGMPLNHASSSLMRRTPGSTFKPIAVYGPAIDQGLITAATVIDDRPVYLNPNKPGTVYPLNYERTFRGLITIRNAITHSVNVVSAIVWNDYLGGELSLQYLHKVGIGSKDDKKYLSMALGAYQEVNPLQMTAAYVPFVNKGMYTQPITYTKVLDMKGNVILEKKPKTAIVYDEASAYVMIDMLKDVVSDGTARRIRIQDGKMPVAGKTGTTSDNKDKWFVGFTPYYTAAVWYGYDRPVTIVPGETSRALDIWQDVMDRVHKGLAIKDFPEPESIVKKSICRYSGKVATELCALDPRGSSVRQEIFIPGTEPSDKCNIHVKASVCKDSLDPLGRNLLSGDYCPFESIIEQVFIQRPNPYVQKEGEKAAPQDSKYDLPTEYCNIHGPSNVSEPTTDDPENPTPSDIPPEDGTISVPEDRTISPMWDFE